MRVSTSQFYLQSALQMSKKSSDVSDQMAHLSSGKRVHTAKDDAVQFGTLSGYKDSLANIEKYQRNIMQAQSHNNLQEVSFSDAEDVLNRIKEQMLQANNGTMSTEDLQALADQTKNSFEQLLDIANTQNENGAYVFSGYQVEQQPFSQQVDGSVLYSGDSGIKELQIAKNINITTNQAGDAAFLKVDNAIGDFTAVYPTTPTSNTSGVALASANVSDRNTYNGSAIPHNYSFDFDAITADLTVTDSGGATTLFPVSAYEGGQTITFDGIDVTLSGNPLPGESFDINEQEEISIFDVVNAAISWMDKGSISTGVEQHQVDYSTILEQLSTALNHVTSRRVDAGIRLQVIDNQKDRHLDNELAITDNRGQIEDLDFAKAISEFEQAQIALQASQQTFTKIQGLTLFNYI